MNKKEDPGFCGIDTVWTTGKDDPFWEACKVHDRYYNLAAEGLVVDLTSRRVDKEFLEHMSIIAKKYSGVKRLRLELRKYVYYGLVRVVGTFRWKWVRNSKVD